MAKKRIGLTAELRDELQKGEFYITIEGRVYKVRMEGDLNKDISSFMAGYDPEKYLKEFIRGYLSNHCRKANSRPPEKFSLEMSLEESETPNPPEPSQQPDAEVQK
jgi:hypothetical protein